MSSMWSTIFRAIKLIWKRNFSSCCRLLLYSASLRSQADSLCTHVILHVWIAFYSTLEYLLKWCTCSAGMSGCHMKLLLSRHVLCPRYNHAPCHFMQRHTRGLYYLVLSVCVKQNTLFSVKDGNHPQLSFGVVGGGNDKKFDVVHIPVHIKVI